MRIRSLTVIAIAVGLWAVAGCGDSGPAPGTDSGPGDGGGLSMDGGNTDAGETVRMRCGNGMVEGTEECDDGNRDPDDDCATDCSLECGDGLLNGTELCDPAIASGEAGACPATCDDSIACTSDALTGSECTAECVHGDISAPADGDGCCPASADASSDDDCAGSCGDGFVTGAETCDTAIAAGTVGACSTACDDGVACTADALENAGTCDAACTNTAISAAGPADTCCPSGATAGTDPDCAIACGDGVVSAGETCDTAIATGTGSCPTACDDGMACTADMLVGSGTCAAACTSSAITTPTNSDGCCPAGATIATDNDCTATCGDDVVSGGEACDTGITTGAGRCPTTCSDGMSCTRDVLTGGGSCAATCSFPAITAAAAGDGCCPPGATIATDGDCAARCGDGVRSTGETCDTAIAAGAGACPTACDDTMVCTTDTLANAGTCTAACMNTVITTPTAGDGCCPTGATIGTDMDCAARCGDGVVTAPETCDDGNVVAGDGCSATCTGEIVRTAYRFTDLDLREPHAFATVPILGCADVTDLNVFGQKGVNPILQDRITLDTSPADGQLDLSLAMVFAPLAQAAGSSTMSDLVFPDCTAPMSSTMCTLPMGEPHTVATAMNQGAGATCLGVLAGTVRPYSTPVTPSVAPAGGTCFVANAGTVTISLAGIPIVLEDARIAGAWSGTPATQILDGLIRGFISVATGNATIIPPGTTGMASIDGQPLSSLFRGGAGNCSQPAPMTGDRDTLAGTTTSGWYVYLNFRAARVPYTEL